MNAQSSYVERSRDPGLSEAWWWLGAPVATAAALLGIHAVAPDFYRERLLPDGYGVLEILHFAFPLIGFLVCMGMQASPRVKAWPLLRAAIVVFAIACFYIAGEEMSWGQWIFHWNTPEYWSAINRQQETNLHNTSYYFNQLPQTLLQIAIVVGGVLLPVAGKLREKLNLPIIEMLTPPLAILPVALLCIAFKSFDRLEKSMDVSKILMKPSEATETFFFMFIMFYTLMLARRVKA